MELHRTPDLFRLGKSRVAATRLQPWVERAPEARAEPTEAGKRIWSRVAATRLQPGVKQAAKRRAQPPAGAIAYPLWGTERKAKSQRQKQP